MNPRKAYLIKIAVFLFIVGAGVALAEVKLRIYLKDGTLQAGNLVAENKDAFVLLSREGRVEIPKEKIMFVNGKSLEQWEARPDKLYQTEILPSEIPNPSYVMDKAALEKQQAAERQAIRSQTLAAEPAAPQSARATSFDAAASAGSPLPKPQKAITFDDLVKSAGSSDESAEEKPKAALKKKSKKSQPVEEENPGRPVQDDPYASKAEKEQAEAAAREAAFQRASGLAASRSASVAAMAGDSSRGGAGSLGNAAAITEASMPSTLGGRPVVRPVAPLSSGAEPSGAASPKQIVLEDTGPGPRQTAAPVSEQAQARAASQAPSNKTNSSATQSRGGSQETGPDAVQSGARSQNAFRSASAQSGRGSSSTEAAAAEPVRSVQAAGPSAPPVRMAVSRSRKTRAALAKKPVAEETVVEEEQERESTTSSPVSSSEVVAESASLVAKVKVDKTGKTSAEKSNKKEAAGKKELSVFGKALAYVKNTARSIKKKILPSKNAKEKPEGIKESNDGAEEVASASAASKPKGKSSPVVAAQSAKPVKPVAAPGGFSRANFSNIHFMNAQEMLAQGEPGRALQELHMATLLNRRDAQAAFLLGKTYAEIGPATLAIKYLKAPILNKNEEAKELIEEIQAQQKAAERARWMLYASAGAGTLTMFPLVLLSRRLFRRSKTKTADAGGAAESAQKFWEEATQEASAQPEPAGFTNLKSKPKTSPAAPQAPALPPLPAAAPIVQPVIQAPPVVAPKKPEPLVPIAPILPPLPVVAQAPAVDVPQTDFVPEAPVPVFANAPDPAGQEGQSPELVVEAPRPLYPQEQIYQDALAVSGTIDSELENGNRFAVEGQMDNARRAYRTALALKPLCVDAYLGLGYLYFAEGNWEMSLSHYERALDINPRSADAYYGIGSALIELGRPAEAVPAFQRTLSIDPTFVDARDALTALGRAA